jgi:phage shock protein A
LSFDTAMERDEKKRRASETDKLASGCRMALGGDVRAIATLRATLNAYDDLMAWLDEVAPPTQSHDLVVLHRAFYDQARSRSTLPAQMVTLGLREWAQRRQGELRPGVPLDTRLFSVKSVSSVSIATVSGRLAVPFSVAGYGLLPTGPFAARLVEQGAHFEIWVAAPPDLSTLLEERRQMVHEPIFSRIGRVIAGMAHAAVDGAEDVNPKAVLEQTLREIDAAAEEVRLELGGAMAERHRLEIRRSELAEELRDLDGKIKLAVDSGLDELAADGIDRQLDIEAQAKVLDKATDGVDQRIALANETLDAVKASRKEAEARLSAYLQSLQANAATVGAGAMMPDGRLGRAASVVERAEAVVSRVTGTPTSTAPRNQKSIDALNELHRQHAVKERLARLKSDRN